MGETIVGYCDYCSLKIDRDPMLSGEQYCDSCQTHFDLLAIAEEVFKVLESLNPGSYVLEKLRKATGKFCFTV